VAVPLFQPKPGVDVSQIRLGPYGFAETAIRSYREFVERRERGQFRRDARFQVTMPGPGTSTFFIQLAPETLLPLAREALLREVERLDGAVPAADLTIQLDVAMEAEHEEWRRRPKAFDTPIHEEFDWTLEQMAESVAWLANRIDPDAELGFHICSIWHHYPHAGQDNTVLVDIANEIVSRVKRSIGYVHVPTIPEHTEEDFAPFANLRLPPETRLYLGVIHGDDGFEGAIRRIDAARKVIPDFGIASFCGLGQPAAATPQADISSVGSFELRRGRATTRQGATGRLAEASGDPLFYVLDLHRELAERDS
jgi:hypothetical protein